MKWFRFYSEALDDPKVQRLPGDLFKAWVNLLCLANEGEPRGALPSVEDISFRLRLSHAKTVSVLNQLEKLGLLDADVDLGLTPHGWDARQSKSDDVAARVKKSRSRQGNTEECNVTSPVTRNDTSNVTETPQNKNREDTDTEQTEDLRLPVAAAPRKTRAAPKPAEVNRQNPIWDALAIAAGSPATKNERSDFGETVAQLRDAEATVEEIQAFPNWWYESFPGAKLTHRCYREHLGKFRSSPPRPMLPSDIKNPMVRAALTTDMSDITAELEAKRGPRNGLSIENRNPRELFAEPRRIAAGEPRASPHVLPASGQPERG